MKIPQITAFLLTIAQSLAQDLPVTHQDKIPRSIISPWKVEYWAEYSGIYHSLEVDGTGSSRVILTSFAGAKDTKLISACLIIVSDTFVEPSYQIYGSITPDEQTGDLDGYSINNWKMIRYIDPNTKSVVFGISIDGNIYVDRSKGQKEKQNKPEMATPRKPSD